MGNLPYIWVGLKMYIRETLFFDTFVLVVKKQHNTRTVWSGIFF